jgi:hypothetical protein
MWISWIIIEGAAENEDEKLIWRCNAWLYMGVFAEVG